MQQIKYFIENDCGGTDVIMNMTTTDICNIFLIPLTIDSKVSYCEQFKTIFPNEIKKANCFVSHAWKYNFLEVFDTLCHHFKNDLNTVVWFDLFTNSQHNTDAKDFDWWQNVFKEAIGEFNHTVLILQPLNDPVVLTRGWCLYEIYFCTIEKNCKFKVALSATEQGNFIISKILIKCLQQ